MSDVGSVYNNWYGFGYSLKVTREANINKCSDALPPRSAGKSHFSALCAWRKRVSVSDWAFDFRLLFSYVLLLRWLTMKIYFVNTRTNKITLVLIQITWSNTWCPNKDLHICHQKRKEIVLKTRKRESEFIQVEKTKDLNAKNEPVWEWINLVRFPLCKTCALNFYDENVFYSRKAKERVKLIQCFIVSSLGVLFWS